MRKKKYVVPDTLIINNDMLLQGETGAVGSGGFHAEAKGNNGWLGNFDETPSAPTPVGGTAAQGTGKEALELPTQNRRIWGD